MRNDNIQPASDFRLCMPFIIQVWQPTAATSTLSFVFFLSSHLSPAAQEQITDSSLALPSLTPSLRRVASVINDIDTAPDS